MSAPRFIHARATSAHEARTVVLGADTRGAGFSVSARGAAQSTNRTFCMDAVREADNESPSLAELLDDGGDLFDAGNIELDGDAAHQMATVRARCAELLGSGKRTLLLGGDHLVKHALFSAVSDVAQGPVGLVFFDAHPDCAPRDEIFFGSILHHAWKLPGFSPRSTSIVGLRQCNAEERDALRARRPSVVHARDFVVKSFDTVAREVCSALVGTREVVFSIDLDGLRPSDAPAVESPYPGGPSIDELLELVRVVGRAHRLVAMDVTEFLVDFDPAKLTALAVARLVKEFSAAGKDGGSLTPCDDARVTGPRA